MLEAEQFILANVTLSFHLKITLWEFFITKMKHHVVGNHVMGIHVKWGTAVIRYSLINVSEKTTFPA